LSIIKISARNRAPVSLAIRSLSSSAESYTERMAKKGRPMSPSVTVYKFPLVALTSITVRVTGCLLTVGMGGMATVSLAGGDIPALVGIIAGSSIAPLAKFSVAFPLVYHYLGGVRHSIWDYSPEMIQNTSVEQASWALIGTASVASVGLSCYTMKK